MIPLSVILWIILSHFVVDFILQSDKMAMNKSKSWFWLSVHCGVYTLGLLGLGPIFAVVNGILHLTVDAITSRVTSYLWSKEQRHWFFVVIGLDQAIHMSVLMSTYVWLSRSGMIH